MSYTVELIQEQPSIVVVKVWGDYDHVEAAATSEKVHALTAEMPAPIFRISDATELNWDFEQMQESFSHHIQQAEGSITDPRMVPILVGGGMLSEIYQRGLEEDAYGHVTLYLYDSVEDAIDAINAQELA